MADAFFPTVDAETGEATQTPIEAVASQYANKKIKFRAGSRIPVKLNGVEGSVPAEQYDEALNQGATPYFDPHGEVKAAVAGLARSVTFTGSDYLSEAAARAGAAVRGENTDQAAKDARATLQGLRDEHPDITTASELGGVFLPTGIEGLAVKVGKAAHLFQGAEEAAQAVKTAHEFEQGAQVASEAARAEAATGKLAGSTLSKAAKWVDPYQYVAAAGRAVESPLSRILGPTVGRIGGMAAEGGIMGAVGAVDESELGDTPLTGEAIYGGMEHGALFGGTLGLVAAGGQKILTGVGRIADRLQEAAAGGSRKDYIDSGKRWGWGGLGHADLEWGATPTETAHQGLERIKGRASGFARDIDDVVARADKSFGGASAQEVYKNGLAAARETADKMNIVGGDGEKLYNQLSDKLKEHLGLRDMPEEPVMPTAADEEKLYTAKRMEAGLPNERELSKLEPKPVSETEVAGLAKKLATSGLYEEGYVATVKGMSDEFKAAAAAGDHARAKEIIDGLKTAREDYFTELGRQEAHARFAKESLQYDAVKEGLERVRGEAHNAIQGQRSKLMFEHGMNTRAAQNYNRDLKVNLSHVREFRTALDQIIPWNRSKDAVLNAAVEIKQSTRRALEKTIEDKMDGLMNGKDATVLGHYLHAKARYGMAKDLERMYERSTGAEAKSFGHIMSGGYHNLPYAVAGAALGHPVAGVAAALGGGFIRKYGARGAAYALHKAARIAEIKALRTEMQIHSERVAKSTVLGGEPTNFSKVKIPDMPPHQLKMTAAEAMTTVSKMAGFKAVEARLASLDPYTPVIAPKAATSWEMTARRAFNFLLSQIPANAINKLNKGEQISGDDLTPSQARNFMDAAASTQDPFYAPDLLSRGQLTTTAAAAYKTAFPQAAAMLSANIKRQEQADKAAYSMLPPGKKFSVNLLAGDPNPGLTVAVQRNLIQAQMQAMGQKTGKGMSHGTFNRSDGVMSQMMATQTQLTEGSSPGRRGKTGRGAFGL